MPVIRAALVRSQVILDAVDEPAPPCVLGCGPEVVADAELLGDLRERVLDESEPLAGLLRTCLALAAVTGSEALRSWAANELKGYEDRAEVPVCRYTSHVRSHCLHASCPSGATPHCAEALALQGRRARPGFRRARHSRALVRPGDLRRALRPPRPDRSDHAVKHRDRPAHNGIHFEQPRPDRRPKSISRTAFRGG
ncbi:hypothetical protein [Nocardia brasiliensis]|uniref:AbiTii domain-containing protein n=1 Tax=Nocardia brasiliensis TaxID=37326 RepID=UPI003D89F773